MSQSELYSMVVRDADRLYVEQAITQHGFLMCCIMHACF